MKKVKTKRKLVPIGDLNKLAITSLNNLIQKLKDEKSIPDTYFVPENVLRPDFRFFVDHWTMDQETYELGDEAVCKKMVDEWCLAVLTSTAENPREREAELLLGNECFVNRNKAEKLLQRKIATNELRGAKAFPSHQTLCESVRGYTLLYFAPPLVENKIYDLYAKHLAKPDWVRIYKEEKKKRALEHVTLQTQTLQAGWHLIDLTVEKPDMPEVLGLVLFALNIKDLEAKKQVA